MSRTYTTASFKSAQLPESESSSEHPTTSHALANADHEEKGAAQLEGEFCTINKSTANLGWNEPAEVIPDPLVGGVRNEDLWTLVRRFDKQIQHVRLTNNPLPGDLDLNVSSDEAFSPDRLRGNIERLYMTVIIGIITFVKHIARIRSWENRLRTGGFCAMYFLAWFFDLLGPLILSTLMLLILYRPARMTLFPPAPLAAVDSKTGQTKETPSGHLVSHDSMTGAAESQPGEAVEQEAHNFVTSFGAIAISSAAGKPKPEHEDGGGKIPDPTAAAIKATDAKDRAEGQENATKKITKKPVEEAMWDHARPFMQYVGATADMWERVANALSPTAPFPQTTPFKLAAGLLPVFLASFLITPYMVVKSFSFLLGTIFFSGPWLSRGLNYLNTYYPNWKEKISLQNTLLKGVPTNAQLTITLLRIGEANRAPLPPPTSTTHAAKKVEAVAQSTESDEKPEEHQKGKAPRRLLGALKTTMKGAVQTALHTDHLKAKVAGSTAAKNRLGAVEEPEKLTRSLQGPKQFAARYHGVKGVAIIFDLAADDDVRGVTEPSQINGPVLRWTSENEKESWTIPVESILEIEKLGGFGWKGKVVVGWTLDDKELVDAVRIVYEAPIGNEAEQVIAGTVRDEKLLTAVVGREEIVNRLLSMGKQRWEVC